MRTNIKFSRRFPKEWLKDDHLHFTLQNIQSGWAVRHNIIIKNVALRKKLSDALGSVSCGMVGTLGLEGCRIAYNEAEQWLDHLIPVIDRNQHLVRDFFAANFPK